MAQIKREYYIKGVANQKRPDVTFEVRRPDMKILKNLPEIDRSQLAAFLTQCQIDLQQTIDRLKV